VLRLRGGMYGAAPASSGTPTMWQQSPPDDPYSAPVPQHPLHVMSPGQFNRVMHNDPAVAVAMQQAADQQYSHAVSTHQQQQSARGGGVKLQVWELDTKGAAFNCTQEMRQLGMTDAMLARYNEGLLQIYRDGKLSPEMQKIALLVCCLTLGWGFLPCCLYLECYAEPRRKVALGEAVRQFNDELLQQGIPLTFRFEPINQTLRVTLQ